MFDLTGRVALVTGSSRGIGREIAMGLAEAGARVVLNGRDPDRLGETRKSFVERLGADDIATRSFDITDEADVSSSVEAIEREIGPIRILVNNAGLQVRVPLFELTRADWERVLRTNLTGAFLVGREVARRMVNREQGKIINIASVQAELARPTIAAYTAAKGGIRNLTKAMTAEWAGAGVQVNALAPGYIHTDLTQPLVDDPEFNGWIVGRTPARRWGSTADLVGPAVFLSSDASDYVTGQVIFVDGGMTAVV
jgi:gluconate 5-dehydrogenase